MPTRWIRDKIDLEEGELVFIHTGGHSSDSSHVMFYTEGILVAGDLVQVDQYPYFGDPTTDMNAWLNTFKSWKKQPVKKICPGHGRIVNLNYVQKMKKYFENLIDTLRKFKKKSVPVKEVAGHPEIPQGYWGENIKKPRWWDYCIISLYNKIQL